MQKIVNRRMEMIEVLIIDDHMAVGMGTKALIETEDICADVLFDSAEYLSCITKKNMMFI